MLKAGIMGKQWVRRHQRDATKAREEAKIAALLASDQDELVTMLSIFSTEMEAMEAEVHGLRLNCAQNEKQITALRFKLAIASQGKKEEQAAIAQVEEVAQAVVEDLLGGDATEESKAPQPRSPTGAANEAASEEIDINLQPTWNVETWLKGLDLNEIVANAILEQLRARTTEVGSERRFIAKVAQAGGTELMAALLSGNDFVENIAERIHEHAVALANELSEAAASDNDSEAADHSQDMGKFVEAQSGASFTLTYGGLEDFFGGLSSLVGKANQYPLHGLHFDHCMCADSKVEFEVSNYGTVTTSELECKSPQNPNSSHFLRGISLAVPIPGRAI